MTGLPAWSRRFKTRIETGNFDPTVKYTFSRKILHYLDLYSELYLCSGNKEFEALFSEVYFLFNHSLCSISKQDTIFIKLLPIQLYSHTRTYKSKCRREMAAICRESTRQPGLSQTKRNSTTFGPDGFTPLAFHSSAYRF